jgi:glycosyltransferase involved in cell wall biosynthesis
MPALLSRRKCGAVWIADWTDWWGRGGATQERKGWLVRTLIGPLEQVFEEKPRPHADGTVVISRALGKRAEGLGIRAGEILYLPPGADPAAIRETTIQDARRICLLDPDARLLGYLGNIYQRDADLLFAALGQLKAANARLIMVGEPGCRVPESLKERVTITGRLPFDKMLDFLSACDILTLPLCDTIANRGRWPSKLNEYVAVGRPTVACAVGDVADLLREHEIGRLVAPDAMDFAQAIDELIADPVRARRVGDRAREVARGAYSQEAIADKLEKFYTKVIADKAARGVNA